MLIPNAHSHCRAHSQARVERLLFGVAESIDHAEAIETSRSAVTSLRRLTALASGPHSHSGFQLEPGGELLQLRSSVPSFDADRRPFARDEVPECCPELATFSEKALEVAEVARDVVAEVGETVELETGGRGEGASKEGCTRP